MRAQRLRDAVNDVDLWMLLGTPHPCMADGPYSPTLMFEDGAAELARSGRDIAHRAVDVSPEAANDQRMPYKRTERKIHGDGCPTQPLYQPFGDATDAYRVRWKSEQRRKAGGNGTDER